MKDPVKDIKKEDLMKPIEGQKLKEYKSLENTMNLKQLKTSRATIKGLMLRKKKMGLGRLFKNSKTPEGQAKYNKWQEEVKKMEVEVIRWDLTIEAKKNERKGKKESINKST